MATNGQWRGFDDDFEPPWWYPVVRAAKWIGVHPEELANSSIEWVSRILVVAEAEAHAEEVHAKRNRK